MDSFIGIPLVIIKEFVGGGVFGIVAIFFAFMFWKANKAKDAANERLVGKTEKMNEKLTKILVFLTTAIDALDKNGHGGSHAQNGLKDMVEELNGVTCEPVTKNKK